MWGLLTSLFGGGISGVGNAVTGIIKTIWGDKSARDMYAAEEQAAVEGEFAAEFQYRNNRTWWDSLVDGLNRLPRPFMTFGTISMFVWAIQDPHEFSISMMALDTVPPMLWYIFLTIIAFWFGGKILSNAPIGSMVKSVSPAQVAATVKAINDARASDTPAEPDSAYRAEMADTKKPLSNAAIIEWNRRRGNVR